MENEEVRNQLTTQLTDRQLLTPLDTSLPDSPSRDTPPASKKEIGKGKAPANPAEIAQKAKAPRDISADLDTRNVVEGKRVSKKTVRFDAYLADLRKSDELSAFRVAFATGLMHRFADVPHGSKLPPPSDHLNKLRNHPERPGFIEAAEKEYRDLKRRETFSVVDKQEGWKTLPLRWVFVYKFDTDGYLLKHKARLCVRGDLEPPSIADNYAATLATKTFRALMAIAVEFNLEAFQLDAVNALLIAR